MVRIVVSVAIGLFLVLDLALPYTALGRRGNEIQLRMEVPVDGVKLGERFPDQSFTTLDGDTLRLSDLRGHRVLLTFERSVDW